eukprot:2308883-Alexandrium_andersonii.AAC.1
MVLGVGVSEVALYSIQVWTVAAPALVEEMPTYVCTEARWYGRHRLKMQLCRPARWRVYVLHTAF